MINLLNIAIKAAIESSREVLKIYEQGFSVSLKEDESPVTTGDLKANEIITSYILPTDIPILSEESEKDTLEKRKNWKRYWCIDPIDGTKEYVNKTDEYCILYIHWFINKGNFFVRSISSSLYECILFCCRRNWKF